MNGYFSYKDGYFPLKKALLPLHERVHFLQGWVLSTQVGKHFYPYIEGVNYLWEGYSRFREGHLPAHIRGDQW